jgi:membrane protein
MSKRTTSWRILRETVEEFLEDDCLTMAAALAYFIAFALPPLLVVVVAVAGLLWEPAEVRGELQNQIAAVVGEGGWEQIRTMMEAANTERRGVVTMVGFVTLLFIASGVMVQLQAALNKVWQVRPDPSRGGVKNFLLKRMLSLAMVLGIAFLLLVSLVLTTVLSAAGNMSESFLPSAWSAWLPPTIDFVASFAFITLLFGAMFKWLPDAQIAWADAWRGAAVTALLFMFGKFAIASYLATRNPGAFGPAAAFALILMWIYYSSLIFLLGAELTQVIARNLGRRIQPARGAVRMIATPELREPVEEGSQPE